MHGEALGCFGVKWWHPFVGRDWNQHDVSICIMGKAFMRRGCCGVPSKRNHAKLKARYGVVAQVYELRLSDENLQAESLVSIYSQTFTPLKK